MRYFLIAVLAMLFVGSQAKAGLVAYYSFDHFTGDPTGVPPFHQYGLYDDVSDMDNDASAGGSTWVPGEGISGGAVALTNDEIGGNTMAANLGIMEDVSYSFWVNPDDQLAYQEEAILIRTNANGTVLQAIWITGDPPGHPSAYWGTNTLKLVVAVDGVLHTIRPLHANGDMPQGEWTHITIVFDTDYNGTAGTNVLIVYVNGYSDWLTTADGALNGTARIGVEQGHSIGNGPAANDGFNGLMDEVKIFDHALSGAEVAALYTEGLGGVGMLNHLLANSGGGGAGEQGPQGKEGPSGSDGAAGAAGADGAAGAAGAQGAQGKQGDTGANAPCVNCADVADAAVDLTCALLAGNPANSVADLYAAAQTVANSILISANICDEAACDLAGEIQSALDAAVEDK